ncbi:MAG TPA: hypothetical protein VD948_00880 [Rhodothermales bacterium]|nr:hypothetical protein [Rhodothermales bacterium]
MRTFLLIVLIGLGPVAAMRAQGTSEPDAITRRLHELDAALDLSPAQEREVRTLLIGRVAFYSRWAAARLEAKRSGLRVARATLTEGKIQEKARFEASLRAVLTPAQVERYEQFRAEEQKAAQRLLRDSSFHP